MCQKDMILPQSKFLILNYKTNNKNLTDLFPFISVFITFNFY